MAGLREALEPHGRVEDLVVAGKSVGIRLFPRNREVRALVPAGIEFAPPRRERSTLGMSRAKSCSFVRDIRARYKPSLSPK
jgi:hypothetical protein